ncbi:hypothetical protein IDM40_08325 [Nocardiopsis sp. HNM0947]|uniref:Uncharacterized protein n=1 Tax=Nocardiopsis coralli TaxID=2772213 RepID=A0ABR9P4D0_9ACTN|nr:hypothetical protein [Nocardiopsis coralli]MBE2998706.1 hypothetical protein [Nocardiopsis coralli]
MYQSYDRDRLIEQVRELLRQEGLEPTNQTDPSPERAATLMLRSLGVEAFVDHVASLKRSMDHTWEDEDDARAERRNER